MASFYAELHLEGVAIPMLQCSYSFQQTTDARGRVTTRVRQGPLHLLLDVPDTGAELLLSWAATPFKPLAGQVIFYDDSQGRLPRETISFAAGQCVHYEETFRATAAENGAYTCQLTITAPEFELLAGGPAAPVLAAAARVAAAAEGKMANVLPAQVASPKPAVPESGSKYLALTRAAFGVYSQQVAPAMETLTQVLGAFGQVQGRAKSPESAANRIQRAVDNGWVDKVASTQDVLDNLWDAVGTRVVLKDSSPETMSRLTQSLIGAINSGKLNVTKIENLYGQNGGVPYLSAENSKEILEETNLKVTQKPYDSGYTATTVFVKYENGVRGEIQIIGQEALELANAEHLVYDAFLNKPYLGSYDLAHQEEVASQIEPIRRGAQGLTKEQRNAYQGYLSGSYADARRVESGKPVQPPTFPEGVPASLKVDNLLGVNQRTGKYKAKK